jgi:3-(3-hydroxy-phenyl)propionate hydroxylase
VRRFIGSGMDDLGFHERWLVIDALLQRNRPDLGDFSVQHCDPRRPATYIRGTGNRRRWEITIHPDEDAQAATQSARIWELLSRWITPDEAEIERAAVYTFHSAIARQWRNGRLLLAGDSAHQTPPFLGQGMCAGIRDVANLAWKLRDIIAGKADMSLLDTYQSERSPHVREFIELAIRLGGVINTKAMEAGLSTSEARENATVKLEVRKPPLGPGLAIGSLPLAGQLAPQFTLADGRRSDDRTGYANVLLVEKPAALSADIRAALARAGIELLSGEEAGDLPSWLRAHEIQAALVRPDRYLRGAARSDQELDQLVEALCSPATVPNAA